MKQRRTKTTLQPHTMRWLTEFPPSTQTFLTGIGIAVMLLLTILFVKFGWV